MATTEQIRIATPTEAERTRISFLTPEERRDLLVQGAEAKQRRTDEQVARDHLERVLERIRTHQLMPAGVDPEGRPYATNGKMFYLPDENEPMTSFGRVPGRETMHALTKADNSFAFIEDADLREVPTEQDRADEWHFRGEVDAGNARERAPMKTDTQGIPTK